MVNTQEQNAVPDLPVAVLRSVRRLSNRRGRDLAGTFLVEGRQAVREALALGTIVTDVIVRDPSKHADLLEGVDVSLWRATDDQMRQLSDTVTPQGIIAVCRQFSHSLDVVTDARLVVICAQVRDPGNAGTVIRGADAAGADAVIIGSASVDLYNPKVVRSAVGSHFHLPIAVRVDIPALLTRLGELSIATYATDGSGPRSVYEVDLSAPHAWVMGNEAWGMPEGVLSACDEVVAVPLYGRAESLNLAMAATVCLFASARALHGPRAG